MRSPRSGPVSPANKFWFNNNLKAVAHNPEAALRSTAKPTASTCKMERWSIRAATSRVLDRHECRQQVPRTHGVMVQEDLGKLGIKVNVVTLDFPSLLERISQKFNYEDALSRFSQRRSRSKCPDEYLAQLGGRSCMESEQKSPATAWEAEIDKLMRAQASTANPKKRKEVSTGSSRSSTNSRHDLPHQSECAVGCVERGRRRESWDSLSANILERRADHAKRNHVGKPLSKSG